MGEQETENERTEREEGPVVSPQGWIIKEQEDGSLRISFNGVKVVLLSCIVDEYHPFIVVNPHKTIDGLTVSVRTADRELSRVKAVSKGWIRFHSQKVVIKK